MSAQKKPKQGTVWVRKSDATKWVLYARRSAEDGVIWVLRDREYSEYVMVPEPVLVRDFTRLGSVGTCEFPGCEGKRHGRGYCMGHLYQLKAYGDESKLRPLRSLTYGPDAVRLDVRGGILVREMDDLRRLGRRVEAGDPRETNRANIAARHLVREYAAGRATLKEGTLSKPPPRSKERICLAHVGGEELKALTALGESLPPRDANDRVPAQRALRHLLRAYSAGLLVLTPA